jgi:hypothetical protein
MPHATCCHATRHYVTCLHASMPHAIDAITPPLPLHAMLHMPLSPHFAMPLCHTPLMRHMLMLAMPHYAAIVPHAITCHITRYDATCHADAAPCRYTPHCHDATPHATRHYAQYAITPHRHIATCRHYASHKHTSRQAITPFDDTSAATITCRHAATCHMPHRHTPPHAHATCHYAVKMPHAITHAIDVITPHATRHMPHATCHTPPRHIATCHIAMPHATCHMPHAAIATCSYTATCHTPHATCRRHIAIDVQPLCH